MFVHLVYNKHRIGFVEQCESSLEGKKVAVPWKDTNQLIQKVCELVEERIQEDLFAHVGLLTSDPFKLAVSHLLVLFQS